MNFSKLDRARRNVGPLENNLIDSFAAGAISRRTFVTRGSVLGLGVAFMGTIIAACGSDEKTPAGTTAVTEATGSIKQGGTLKIAAQKPAGPLDPVAMANLGTYTPVVMSFEYLVNTLGADLSPMLAESWKPNDDGSVWTFKLRQGVKWHDGKDFTSADVVASMDRLAESNLKAYITAGSTKAIDANTVEITLLAADGQFPYQVGPYNPQALITPVDYVLGTTLDKVPNGTGPFKLTKYDEAVGATFEANADYWDGKPFLDSLEFTFNEDLATLVSGMQAGEVDAIVQFSVIGGDALLADENIEVGIIHGSAHRMLWMNTREGDFTDVRVRQAVALGIDRPALIETILKGKGDIGNDHPIAPIYPYFDEAQPQRTRDIEKAKQLLKDAGKEGLKATMFFPKLQEIPELAQLMQSQLKEIGMDITIQQEVEVDGEEWCKVYDSKVEPAGCDGGGDFGIVDYGPRGVPDVYLVKAYATGEWNSAHYISEPFRAATKAYQAALDDEARKAPIAEIQKIANEDVPYVIPYFYNTLFANKKTVSGIVATGLGHFDCSKAGFTA